MAFQTIRRRRMGKSNVPALRYGTYRHSRGQFNGITVSMSLMAATGFQIGDHVRVEYDPDRRRLRMTKTEDAWDYMLAKASSTSNCGKLQLPVLPDRPLPTVRGGLVLTELSYSKGTVEGTIPDGHDDLDRSD